MAEQNPDYKEKATPTTTTKRKPRKSKVTHPIVGSLQESTAGTVVATLRSKNIISHSILFQNEDNYYALSQGHGVLHIVINEDYYRIPLRLLTISHDPSRVAADANRVQQFLMELNNLNLEQYKIDIADL